MNRQDFQRLALERLEDAQALLRAGRYSGSYYLAGYAVECALKACMAGKTKRGDFPPRDAREYYVHDITKLLDIADLKKQWGIQAKGDPKKSRSTPDRAFEAHWTVVKDWTEESRYRSRTHEQAKALFMAVSDPKHGVLQWLRRYW